MPTSRIEVPADPERRRCHLLGLDAGTRRLDEKDIEAKRPALEPYKSDFDQGLYVGQAMEQANAGRKKALQQGRGGLRHRVEIMQATKAARKLPELP